MVSGVRGFERDYGELMCALPRDQRAVFLHDTNLTAGRASPRTPFARAAPFYCTATYRSLLPAPCSLLPLATLLPAQSAPICWATYGVLGGGSQEGAGSREQGAGSGK